MSTTSESRIRDAVIAVLAFGALALWLWLWWRRAFATDATDALLLWQLGPACARHLPDCYNGFYPFAYPLLLGKLFANDAVYGPTLLNMGACTVAVATFGLVTRHLRAGIATTLIATAALAMHPHVAYAATNPGPDAIALLLLVLGVGIAIDPQIPRRSQRVALGAFVASAAGVFRSELVLLVPAVLACLTWAGALQRRDLAIALAAVACVALPQAAIQAANGLPPWAGTHGFAMWTAQQPAINWHQLGEAGYPGSLRAVLVADPLGAALFWGNNFAQLVPWIVGCMLPAVAARGAATPIDRALAAAAVAWGVWTAGDDIALGTLVLVPVAVLQTARLCVDLRANTSVFVRLASALLLLTMSALSAVILHAQTEIARKAKRRVEDIEALLIDSGATDAQRVFVTNARRYLPSLSPHAMVTPGAWLQLEGAVPEHLRAAWCVQSAECFVRDLVQAQIQFVLVDDTASQFLPSLEPVQQAPMRADPPHPCLSKVAADGLHTVLLVVCTIDPATGELHGH